MCSGRWAGPRPASSECGSRTATGCSACTWARPAPTPTSSWRPAAGAPKAEARESVSGDATGRGGPAGPEEPAALDKPAALDESAGQDEPAPSDSPDRGDEDS